jgi:aminopeptidase N
MRTTLACTYWHPHPAPTHELALPPAARWDEERYGLQYDLELFNIVAVDDFNMGAM